MNRILPVLIVCFLAFNTAYGQKNLNDYRYVIVPTRYDFLDEPDRYRLNSLTKFLFKKYGFDALMANQPFPADLQNDNCLALRAGVIEHKGLMRTKLEVELRDCSNELVFKTKIGQTRVKEYKKAYNLALRDAFESFEGVNYSYNGKRSDTVDNTTESQVFNNDMEPEKEVAVVKTKKEEKSPKIEKITKDDKIKKKPKKVKNEKVKASKDANDDNTYTTKEVFNGYKLLDGSLNEAMTIYSSGVKDVFIVKGKDAIIYKKGDGWIYSETNDTNLLTKVIKIDF